MKNFNCLCCGDCCSGDMTIPLNLYDLYKIGKYLELSSTKELFDKNIVEFYIGQNDTIIPKIKFKSYPYKFCPFLINDIDEDNNLKGFCSLHPYKKPLVCILSPISKIYNSNTKKNSFSNIKPTENCPGKYSEIVENIETFLDPIAHEVDFENKFYDFLAQNSEKSSKIEKESLYYFNIGNNFKEVLSEKTKL